VELTAGAVQIIGITLSGSEMLVVRLRPVREPDGSLQFTTAVPSVPVKWPGQRFPPALSPWLDAPPHERFAYLTAPDASSPGQLTAPVLTVGDLSGATEERVLWKGPAETAAETARRAMASPTGSIPRSVAFSDDGSAIAVRYGTQISVVPLDDSSRPLSFRVPAKVVSAAVSSPIRPAIAAVRLPPASGRGGLWRFALLDGAGVVVLEGDGGNDEELQVHRPWTGEAATLLPGLVPGLNGAPRLRFSRDGGILSLQLVPWSDRVQQVRVWDLRPEWSATIKAARDDTALARLVCERANIEPEGRTLHADERATWIGMTAPEPCPS
jgi:hypothetical protein